MTPAVWPVVVRLLTRAVPARHLSPVCGDLVEDYGRRVAVHGRLRAELWLLGEGVSLAAAYRLRGSAARVRPETWIGYLRSDVRHGWRAARRRPLGTLATVAVLALGIGLVAAMFALADPYLFRALPFDRPHELVWVAPRTFATSNLPTLDEWRARGDLFTGFAATAAGDARDLMVDDTAIALRVAPVSHEFFEVLGLPLALPPEWRAADASGPTPVLLTPAARARVFGRQSPTGRLLRAARPDGDHLRVAGELPASFVDPFAGDRAAVDGFVPLAADRPLVSVEVSPGGTGFRASSLFVLARLRPGVAPAAVREALATVRWDGGRLPTDGVAVEVRPLAARAVRAARAMAVGVLAAGLLVLVVCAANVANLLLARGAARTREFAAREALGASRLAVARLVLVELALVTALGVAAGLAVAKGALVAAAVVIPAPYVTLGAPDLSLRVVLFACAAGGLVVAAGMLPAWAAWRVTPSALLGHAAAGETRAIRALRIAMTVAQTAVAAVLLAGAVLLGRSFVNLVAQDPGYDGDTFALDVRVPSDRAPTSRRPTREDVDRTVARLARLPGVGAAGATTGGLVSSITSMSVASLTLNGQRVKGSVRGVSATFFEAAGSRLVAGRLPGPNDGDRVAVATASFAGTCCAAASPIGRVVEVSGRGFEIVGVVGDVQTRALDEPPGPLLFIPMGSPLASFVTYVLRVDRPDPGLALAAEREILAVHDQAIVSDGATMRQRLLRSVNDRSFATLVAVFFAVAAVGVSAAGLVGVVGCVVARRTREMAVRMALGATASDVVGLATREATCAAAAGAAAGLLVAWSTSRVLDSLLFGIGPAHAGSFAIAACLVVGVVALSAWMPARRATRLSPAVALRVE